MSKELEKILRKCKDQAIQEYIEQVIQEKKKSEEIIKKRIEEHLKVNAPITKVKTWFDHAGEHWQCGLCGSMLHTEFILDGEKHPNFCKECGVLLDWSQK